ncbi:hypothetical protein FRB95_009324 [Tulasnella sp. JGI-2019a]|nr:hypothetical protein FRB95_009324 [Tulasnella sp. JGI-2019a]
MFTGTQITLVVELAILSVTMFVTFVSAEQTLPPYEVMTMEWDWSVLCLLGLSLAWANTAELVHRTAPYNSVVKRCNSITLSWGLLQPSAPPMLGPFTFTLFREGYAPYMLPVGMGRYNKLGNLTYHWNVQLPIGGPYQMALTDANGAVGGVSNQHLSYRPGDLTI